MEYRFIDDGHATVRVEAIAGSYISQAVREATIMALTEQRNVTLVHGGKEYRIIPNLLISEIEYRGLAAKTPRPEAVPEPNKTPPA